MSNTGNQALTIRGLGSEGSVLMFTTGGGITINPRSTFEAKQFHIGGLSFWTFGGTGNAITVNNTQTTTLQNTISDVVIRNVGAALWNNGIYVANQGQLYVRDFFITGANIGINIPASSNFPGSPNIMIESGTIGTLQKGIFIGDFSQSIFIDKVIFNGGNQIDIEGTGNIFQVTVSNSVFSGIIPGAGQTNGDGILINGAGAIQLFNNLMYCNVGFSCVKATNVHGMTAMGNIFRGFGGINGNTGITVGTYPSGGTVPSTIVGNSFSTLATGVNLQTGSSKVNVQSNAYSSNTTNTVNSGTGNTIGGGSP